VCLTYGENTEVRHEVGHPCTPYAVCPDLTYLTYLTFLKEFIERTVGVGRGRVRVKVFQTG